MSRKRPPDTRTYLHQLHLADRAGLDAAAQLREARVEAPVEAHQHGHARGPDRRDAALDALHRQVDRLLAEDRLADARGALDQVGMRVGRAGDDDRVDRRVGEGGLRVRHPGAVARGERGGGVDVDVDDIGEAGARARDVRGMDLADAAGAELAKPGHWVVPWSFLRQSRSSARPLGPKSTCAVAPCAKGAAPAGWMAKSSPTAVESVYSRCEPR